MQTESILLSNKPDIIICDNEKETCLLIDVVISGDRKVIKKDAEKILKYKDLTIEIQRMWSVKTNVTPVTIRASGTISKSFRRHLRNIQRKHEIKELQKTAILGTAPIMRKVLIYSIIFVINCSYRLAVTICALETWFFHVSVNTLHK
jgi:hypothetical protein